MPRARLMYANKNSPNAYCVSAYLLLSLLLALAFQHKAAAQWRKLEGRFTNYDVLDGLSDRGCNVAIEGKDQLIWIGTNEGLNRFDGAHFKHYFFDENDPTSISGNIVLDLLPVDSGLWVATTNGLCFYNHYLDQFERFSFDHYSKSGNMAHIKNIFPDGTGKLFLGFFKTKVNAGGLLLFDPKTKTAKAFDALAQSSVQGMSFFQGDEHGLWITGEYFGRLDLQSEEFENFGDKEDPFAWDVYNNLIEHQHRFYIATWSYGILEFDPIRKEFLGEYHFDPEPYIQRNVVRSIKIKNDSSLYITSADRGFGEFNTTSKAFSFYQNEGSDPYSIPYISGRNTAFDSQGNLLVSMASGLAIKSPYTHQIPFIPFRAYEKQNDRTSSFRNAHISGDLLVVAASYSKEYNIFKLNDLSYVGAIKGMSGVEMVKHKDRIFTMSVNKAYELFPQKQRAELVIDLERDIMADGFSSNVNTLFASSSEWLYLGSDDNSIHRYHPETKELQNWWLEGEGPTEGRPNVVYELAETADGSIWAACALGLYVLKNGVASNVTQTYPELKLLENKTLIALAAHGNELLIGSSENGLYVYDIITKKLEHYGRKEGMAGLRIGELTVDHHGNTWGLSSNGMFVYLKDSKSIENYGLEDGLLSYDLVTDEINTLDDGRIFVGYGKGLSLFSPEDLLPTPLPKKTIISEVAANGVVLKIDSAFAFKKQLNFPKDINRLELAFQAVTVVNAQKVRYAYRLLGHQEVWTETREPNALFTDLKGGEYLFELKTGLEDGRWNEEDILKMPIVLPLSWYRTSGFYIFSALFVLAIAGFILRWRTQSIRAQSAREAEYQQKLAETEMMALRAQMNPHFLFNCLNSIKFFIINNETDKASDYLGKFGRLIRLILQNSEETTITLDLELEALQLYVDLESLRFENKFQFILKVENNVSPEMIEIPPLIIQPFVENAIWHGLMHAHRQGKLLINISMQNDELLCIIEDNGVGRAEAGRLGSKSVMKKKSMGLDITKNRLKLINPDAHNNNSVSMEDLFDQDRNASGTRVSLRIPI